MTNYRDSPLGPVYKMSMDPAAEAAGFLKTGPRTVYIHDHRAVKALDAWLSVHPFRKRFQRAALGQRRRWLGCDVHDHEPAQAPDQDGGLGRHRGPLPGQIDAARPPAHLRHREGQPGLERIPDVPLLGWKPGSKTPGIYVHLKLSDQRARILADAERQAQVAQSSGANPAVQALLDLVRQAAGPLRRAATTLACAASSS